MADAVELPNVARVNRALSALWRRRIMPRPVLEPEALEAAALRGQPRSALGEDRWWREPFEQLVGALGAEADLNPLGTAMAHGQIVMALRTRMRAAALWRAHPEILERPIRAPIIILGQMRSGTTRMQRLLACDERLDHTRLFEALTPVPPKRRFDRRRIRAAIGLAMLRTLNPELPRIHPVALDAPEEEFGLFCFSFGSPIFEGQWRVPSFARWWEQADRKPLYREFKALLQSIAWLRGSNDERPWIIKAPVFMQDLHAVLETFPDARLIRLHRDLEQVVPSSCSLVWNQMRVQSRSADPAWVGREWLYKTRLRGEIAADALDAHADVPRIDVEFAAMNRDWRREMERVYDFLGLPLGPDLVRRMAAWLDGARAHVGHRYSLEQFGLAPADVARAAPERPGPVRA